MYKPSSFSIHGVPNKFKDFSKRVCIFIDGLWFDSPEYKNADIKVFVGGCEPDCTLRQHYSENDIINNQNKFDLILTSSKNIVANTTNSILFPFGSGWVSKDFKRLSTSYEISFICGAKNWLPGHHLRHQIFHNLHHIKNIPVKQIYSTNFQEGHKDYIFHTSQFSIVVENSQYENYFTEKIVDCLYTKTIPLYWGCPNIGDYFNMDGIITFSSIEELFRIISVLNDKIYFENLDAIEENYITATKYFDFFDRVNKEIDKIIG